MRLPSPTRTLVPLAAALALAAPGSAVAQPDQGRPAGGGSSAAVHDEHFPPVGGATRTHDEHFPPVPSTTPTTVGATGDGDDGVLSVETAAAGAVGATLTALAALGLATVRRRLRVTA